MPRALIFLFTGCILVAFLALGVLIYVDHNCAQTCWPRDSTLIKSRCYCASVEGWMKP